MPSTPSASISSPSPRHRQPFSSDSSGNPLRMLKFSLRRLSASTSDIPALVPKTISPEGVCAMELT